MKQFTIQLSPEAEKMLLTDVLDIQSWLQNIVDAKIIHLLDTFIDHSTNLNHRKMTKLEKEQVISNIQLKTAAEKNAEYEESLRSK